jgi:hypothetical protein
MITGGLNQVLIQAVVVVAEGAAAATRRVLHPEAAAVAVLHLLETGDQARVLPEDKTAATAIAEVLPVKPAPGEVVQHRVPLPGKLPQAKARELKKPVLPKEKEAAGSNNERPG